MRCRERRRTATSVARQRASIRNRERLCEFETLRDLRAAHVVDELRKSIEFSRSTHQIDLWMAAKEIKSITLGHATDHAQNEFFSRALSSSDDADAAVRLLLGLLANRAGIEEDDLCILGSGDERVSKGAQLTLDEFAVEFVHLAAECFEIDGQHKVCRAYSSARQTLGESQRVADRSGVLRAGQGIGLCAICLLVMGVVFVNSASLDVTGDSKTTFEAILGGRSTLFALGSALCLLVGSRIPVQRLGSARGLWNPVWAIILVIFAGIVLVHVPGIGREVNGASRWITIGPVTFQPSEIAKWGMPLVLAWWCCSRGEKLRTFWGGFVPPIAFAALVAMGIAIEDLGTATLVMLIALIVVVAAGCRWWHAALLAPVAIVGFVGLIIVSPYRVNRIIAYLDPYADSQGIGYHIIQSMGAISGGGVAGRGLGNSVQKFGYLPEGTTDFIYAIICEETGIIGAFLVITLYALLLWCGWLVIGALRETRASVQTPRLAPYSQLVGLGILATIGFQALINILVVTGLAPTKGIALPLLSRGGTGWMLTCLSLGLIMSMDRVLAREDAVEGVAETA